MAEVFRVISSIGKAADTAYIIQKDIRRLARDLGHAQEDIRKFATDIKDFSLVISTAILILHEYAKKSPAETNVLRSIHHHKQFTRVRAASNRVIDHIHKIWPRLESLESKIPFGERLKWATRRPQVEALGPKMESVKSTLNLSISVVVLESLLNQGESREVNRLVKRLKRQIRHQKEEIAELAKQLRFVHEKEPENGDEDFFDLQVGVQEVIDLGENMIDQRRVLDLDHSPASSFASRAATRPHLASRLIPKPHARPNSPPPALRPARTSIRPQPVERTASRAPPHRPAPVFIPNPDERPEAGERPGAPVAGQDEGSPVSISGSSTTTTSSDNSSLATTVESRELRVQPLNLTHKRRRIPRKHEQEDSSPTEIEAVRHDLSEQSSPVELEGASTISKVDEDFVSVGPKSYLLQLNSTRPMIPTQGYVNIDHRAISITALLDKTLDHNLISLARVQRLGLEMEPPDDEDPVYFSFENGEKRKGCGQVVILWNEGVQYRKPFRVRCVVYEHDIRPLVFGKPFLERKRHYWGGDDGVEVEER